MNQSLRIYLLIIKANTADIDMHVVDTATLFIIDTIVLTYYNILLNRDSSYLEKAHATATVR
jgi:hypothetical protein